MAAYCQVYGVIRFTSPAGRLPVHRDQTNAANHYATPLGRVNLGWHRRRRWRRLLGLRRPARQQHACCQHLVIIGSDDRPAPGLVRPGPARPADRPRSHWHKSQGSRRSARLAVPAKVGACCQTWRRSSTRRLSADLR